MKRLAQISLIEEVAANALPPSVLKHFDGWRLRYNFGVTRRANSALANDHLDRLSLEEKLELTKAFYTRLGVPARFQVCPSSQPPELDAVLEARGYRFEPGALVQTATVSRVMAGAELGHDVVLLEHFNNVWFDLYFAAEKPNKQQAEVRRASFTRIPCPTAYVLVKVEGRPAAVGIGVLERGRVGMFNMATHPDMRRRGAASSVIHALAQWAEQRGAEALYLQVAAGNTPAQALYGKMGFETLYAYHYREAASAAVN